MAQESREQNRRKVLGVALGVAAVGAVVLSDSAPILAIGLCVAILIAAFAYLRPTR